MYNLGGKIVSPLMPVAGSNLQNAMENFQYARKNKDATIIDSRSKIEDKNLNNIMDSLNIPKNSPGIIYNSNSIQSINLFKSNKIQEYINSHYQDFIHNKQNVVYDIEFTWKNSQGDIENKDEIDNFAGIQHCKIYNPHITKDGYFEATIIDYYDFAQRLENNIFDKINNWGYSMQKKGYLKNYFNIYQIRGKVKK